MHYILNNIERYLMSCRELTAFCSHNAWIDKQTLRYEIIEQNDRHVVAFVQFQEVLMEGTGTIAGRIPCEGHLHLVLDHYGQVEYAELL